MNMVKFTACIIRYLRIFVLFFNEGYLLALLILIAGVGTGMINSTSVNFKSLAFASAGSLNQIWTHRILSVILALTGNY
jgi:hypothetical protein